MSVRAGDFDMVTASSGPDLTRALNVVALYAVVAVLGAAFWVQFAFDNLPCPLCLLQRVAFTMMAAGLIYNLKFGPSARGYGIVLLGAAFGGAVSVRQILLHIAPGDPGYGAPVFGLHDYTWAALIFGVAIVATAIVFLFDRGLSAGDAPRRLGGLAWLAILLGLLVTLANAALALIECGFAVCPDNPVTYQLMPSLPSLIPF